MSEIITRADPRWNTTYPTGLLPIAGESLASFVLRLDQVNGLDAGATVRAIKTHRAGPRNTTGPGNFLGAATMNLGQLATLAGAALADIEGLTAVPLVRWLFEGRRGSTTIVSAPALRICPACLQTGVIPLVTLFRGIDACLGHGLALLGTCACGDPINLFPGAGGVPFSCAQPGCRTRYVDLAPQQLEPAALATSNALARAYADLLTTAPGRQPLPLRELGARLRAALLATGINREDDPKLFSRVVHPSTATIADVLVCTNTRAEMTLGQPVDRTQRSRGQRSAALALGPTCPNTACPGGRIYLNGHTAALGDQQERLCKGCGTRWTASRILFSFDRVAGYSIAKAAANAARLVDLRRRVDSACAESFERGVPIVRTNILSAAGVPDSLVYLSARAGLIELVARWRTTAFPR